MGASLPWARRRHALLELRMGAAHLRTGGRGVAAGLASVCPIESGGVEGANAALRTLLSGRERTPVDVHMACGWTRLLLLPWMDKLSNELRWQTFAQARFEQVFGESTEAWDIQVARDLPGRDRFAVAWPQALRQTLLAHRNIASVRVGLLEHLTVLLAHEPQFSGCLIEIESDGAGFVLLVNGRPRRVRWSRFEDDPGLSAAVRSEWASVLASESEDPVSGVGLGLTPPTPDPDSARASTVGALAAGLGFNRAFSLPEWP